MSNPYIYTMYHDAYCDTGDFGGDIHRAMDEVAHVLDEQDIKFTKSGKVFAEVEPKRSLEAPEDVVYAEREVKVYPADVGGADNPQPVRTEMRMVPVKRIPKRVLLPGEEPKSNSAFDRALVRAKQDVQRPKVKGQNVCPFTGTLSMLWYGIKAQARSRKLTLDENLLDDALRMIQKSIPEATQPSFPLYQHFISRLSVESDLHEAMECLLADFTTSAHALQKLQGFTNEREDQLDEVARSLGRKADDLVHCDIEGNVIGGHGAWLTNHGRWTNDDDNEGQGGELYADHYHANAMHDALDEQVRDEAFNRIRTGAGEMEHQLIFDPKYLIKKNVDAAFSAKVPTYTLFFWPKGDDPTEDNMLRFEVAGYWCDIKRQIQEEFPKDKWAMELERGEKTFISTMEPMYRRPSWHLACTDIQCDGRRYTFTSTEFEAQLNEHARMAATPDEWLHMDDREMAEHKRDLEEMFGDTLFNHLELNARNEVCPKCGAHMTYVNPTTSFKKDGEKIEVPKMTVCHNYDWFHKPIVMNDWNQLLSMYAGDKVKAAERMDTISTKDGILYAEQAGETTYTWKLDWLQQDAQTEVRKLRGLIIKQDLTDLHVFNDIRDRVTRLFTKKQRRYLIDQLYAQRSKQQWSLVEESPFVAAIRAKLSFVTVDTFHEAYALLVQILMTNKELCFAETNYGWALLNALKHEFQMDADAMLLTGEGCELHTRWANGLKEISFRHLTAVTQGVNALRAVPESIFLIREAVKAARRRLAAVARTTRWIEEQENYLYSVENGDVRADQDRIDDIVAASWLAHSAKHLAARVKEVLSV